MKGRSVSTPARRYRWRPSKGRVPCKGGHDQCIADRELAFRRHLANDVQRPFVTAMVEVGHPGVRDCRDAQPVQEGRQPAAARVALLIALANHRRRLRTAVTCSVQYPVEAIGPHGVPEKAHRNGNCQSPNTQLTVYADCADIKPETAGRGSARWLMCGTKFTLTRVVRRLRSS
jgi:hypothetical protein